MANIKSQKKRILTNAKAQARNKAVRAEVRTRTKAALAAGDAEGDETRAAIARIDRAVTKGVIAATLNMSVEELDAAKEAGQSWEEIAEAQGVAFETVLNAVKASMTAQVNEALAAGEITQEKADKMLERIATMDSLSKGNGRGHHRGDRDGATDTDETGTEETGTEESIDSTESLTRGTTFSASGVSFVATDFVYLPSIASVQN